MSRDTCRYGTCTNDPGAQDRDDYNARLFCSIQCETKHDHIKADARDARRDAQPDEELQPGRRP
jgi:hypothetical protein